jgi:hypothetical protein
MIRKLNFEHVAKQYVSMVHGMRIEDRLEKLEGVDPSVVQDRMYTHIAEFIELLK